MPARRDPVGPAPSAADPATDPPADMVSHPADYAQATRLLTQLRTVARQLPGHLDPGSIADRLLDEVRRIAPADRAAVLTSSGGGRLVVLAQTGNQRSDWETELSADTPVAEAWLSQQPQAANRPVTRSRPHAAPVSSLVLPLTTGVRTVGLVVLECDRVNAYPAVVLTPARHAAETAALRLETALLFEDVRSIATTEERQRLAREIHDGVAQELVMIGYGIDHSLGLLAESSAATPAADLSGAEDMLRSVRDEVTRVITELRLSLFELRSDVDPHGGLGTAIADYARTVGAAAGMRVHLSMDETGARLPAAVEGELLRIAQEAITNARKHAHAENLWVSCAIDPPYAHIEVSDDGRGMSAETRDGRFGMSIMAERAERIRATVKFGARSPAGTTVSVSLGGNVRTGTVAVPKEVDPQS